MGRECQQVWEAGWYLMRRPETMNCLLWDYTPVPTCLLTLGPVWVPHAHGLCRGLTPDQGLLCDSM